jgi:hypothetical protein
MKSRTRRDSRMLKDMLMLSMINKKERKKNTERSLTSVSYHDLLDAWILVVQMSVDRRRKLMAEHLMIMVKYQYFGYLKLKIANRFFSFLFFSLLLFFS